MTEDNGGEQRNGSTEVEADSLARRILDDRPRHALELCGSGICPLLLADERDELQPHASGVLLAVADGYFLLSAAHVFDGIESSDVHVPRGDEPVGLAGALTSVCTDSSGGDEIDVSVVELEQKVVEIIGAGAFLHPDRFSTVVAPPGGIYVVLGFPASLARPSWQGRPGRSKAMGFADFEVSTKDYEELKRNRTTHVAVKFDRKRVSFLAGEGMAPKPGGLSGCAVLHVDDLVATREDASRDRIVGILNEHEPMEPKALIATRIELYFETIRLLRPDLVSSLPERRGPSFRIRPGKGGRT